MLLVPRRRNRGKQNARWSYFYKVNFALRIRRLGVRIFSGAQVTGVLSLGRLSGVSVESSRLDTAVPSPLEAEPCAVTSCAPPTPQGRSPADQGCPLRVRNIDNTSGAPWRHASITALGRAGRATRADRAAPGHQRHRRAAGVRRPGIRRVVVLQGSDRHAKRPGAGRDGSSLKWATADCRGATGAVGVTVTISADGKEWILGMTSAERKALLSIWIKPSSDSEKDQQDRAERMVTDAIEELAGVRRRRPEDLHKRLLPQQHKRQNGQRR